MNKIMKYSEDLNYEMALDLKKELEYIDIVLDKQKVELPEVFYAFYKDNSLYVIKYMDLD